MKNICSFLLFAFVTVLSVSAQKIPCTDSARLNAKLNTIRDIDQHSRKEFIKTLAENNSEKTKSLALQMRKTDSENQQFMSELLDNCGWPQGLSAESNHTIFLVIDHGEIDYATKYYPLVKQQTELGIIPKSDLATLHDRIMLRTGKMQLYGTQTIKIGSIIKVWPINDQAGLDERRKLMGLQTMDEYIQTLKKTYRTEVYWDKSLTIEEAQQLMVKKP